MPDPEASDRLRATGERIDSLLDASGSGGAVARERAEELVRLVADLYGSGIERILDRMHDIRLSEEHHGPLGAHHGGGVGLGEAAHLLLRGRCAAAASRSAPARPKSQGWCCRRC